MMGKVINKLEAEAIGIGPDTGRACGVSRSCVLDASAHVSNPAQVGALDHEVVRFQATNIIAEKCYTNI